ncbi:MAG: hypothetical protein ABEI57_04230 [Halapricum sp.]
MAAQHRQGDDESAAGGVGEERAGDPETRIEALESALDRRDEQLRELVERYEHVLATHDRLQREADRNDETFVWTGQRSPKARVKAVFERL